MSFYTKNKEGMLTEVPIGKVETPLNNGVKIYSGKDLISELSLKVGKLQEQNKIMKEALEFYADGDNYGHISPEVATYSVIDNCDLGVGDFMLNETVDDERVGGKRAREALAKVTK